MQLGLDIGAEERFTAVREELREALGPCEPPPLLPPTAQLVKAMISSRTYDAVSAGAYDRLAKRFPTWDDIAEVSADDVQAAIFDVTWPEQKASQVIAVLRLIRDQQPDYDLRFLRRSSVSQGLAWLETLPGVGRKISAATLNFSTLSLPALVIDSHVLRVLRRLRLVDPRANIEQAYDTAMRSLSPWSTAELQDLHVLVKFLGQTFCHETRPDCLPCPLLRSCGGYGSLKTSTD